MAEELVARIHVHHPCLELPREHVHHHLRFAQAQEAMVHEDAGELVTDGAMDQRRRDTRIDPAAQPEQYFLGPHLLADPGHRFLDVVAHDPVRPRPCDVEHEPVEQSLPLDRVRHLGMELHAVVPARLVRHPGDRAARRRGEQLEPGRQSRHLVAVAHPHLEHPVPLGGAEVLDAVEQPGVPVCPHLGVAELTVGARLHLTAQLHRHGEHSIADPQHRHAGLPHRLGGAEVAVFVGAGVAAGEDDAPGLEVPDELVADVVGMDLAVDVRLSHAPRDQLRNLRTEIEYQDPVVLVAHLSSLVTRSLRKSSATACRGRDSQARPPSMITSGGSGLVL